MECKWCGRKGIESTGYVNGEGGTFCCNKCASEWYQANKDRIEAEDEARQQKIARRAEKYEAERAEKLEKQRRRKIWLATAEGMAYAAKKKAEKELAEAKEKAKPFERTAFWFRLIFWITVIIGSPVCILISMALSSWMWLWLIPVIVVERMIIKFFSGIAKKIVSEKEDATMEFDGEEPIKTDKKGNAGKKGDDMIFNE